jgi:quercetin dioxygenase-like cupin family protein
LRSRVLTAAALTMLALATLSGHAREDQYGRPADRPQDAWENDRVRLTQISVAPGAAMPSGANRVLIHFTADADGRMPQAAVWQPAGSVSVTNRGPSRLEAIAIELKDVGRRSGGTPPEVLDARYGVDVTPLVDNSQVLVARHRYAPGVNGGPLHAHPDDVILVYLRAGYAWPADAFLWPTRFRRGDIEIVPANTFHRLANAGPDPLEMLVIVPR